MTVVEKLAALRAEMAANQVDVYYIPTNDFHGSEYVGEYFKCREFLSGFTGSAGDMVVTAEMAGLWTDGRYFLQAQQQLEGTGITLFRLQEEGVPTVEEYLRETILPGQLLGFDGRVVEAAFAKRLEASLREKDAEMDGALDLVGAIWKDRPPLSKEPVITLPMKYTGVGRDEKLKRVSEWLRQKADYLILTSLDDIAWLLNIRGGDIHCNPVALAYMVISPTQRYLFAQEEAFSQKAKIELSACGVILRDYHSVYDHIRQLPAGSVAALDMRTVNYALVRAVPDNVEIKDIVNPTVMMKAVKNSVEIENEKLAHIKDGVAVTRLICWLKHNLGKMPVTEMTVVKKMEQYREMQKNYMGPSFDTISGYAAHGAIVHYSVTPKSDSQLSPGNFLLLDTGGHYLEGTTDITRTILLGKEASQEQKRYYTAVLRGNLNLMAAKFKYGCSGVALDYLAREPLWEIGCDYNHGTGHGVGYLLNVHEGPNAFRYQIVNRPRENAVFEAGMITSDEPGVYLPGKFGIRLENLLLCVNREKTEYGQFLGFEPLTLVPFERDAIDTGLMSLRERKLLNQYHEKVFETISPYLDAEEAEWLAGACAPL